jgi:hypothetical protein
VNGSEAFWVVAAILQLIFPTRFRADSNILTALVPFWMVCRPTGSYPETLELYRKRTGATAPVRLDLRSSLSIQPFEGSRFVRGGRGISIDFGLEVVEKKSICAASFKSKFIDLTMKPRLTIASS